MIIDTHCHLIDEAFAGEVDAVISRALDADVQKIVLACCDETEFPRIIALSRRYPGTLYPTIGIHPENMANEAAGILEDPERVKSLLEAFGILADAGVLIDALYRPGDSVKEEDVYA